MATLITESAFDATHTLCTSPGRALCWEPKELKGVSQEYIWSGIEVNGVRFLVPGKRDDAFAFYVSQESHAGSDLLVRLDDMDY